MLWKSALGSKRRLVAHNIHVVLYSHKPTHTHTAPILMITSPACWHGRKKQSDHVRCKCKRLLVSVIHKHVAIHVITDCTNVSSLTSYIIYVTSWPLGGIKKSSIFCLVCLFCDVKCLSYAKGSLSVSFANAFLLQKWPVLDAISLKVI